MKKATTIKSNRPIDFPLALNEEVYGNVMHVMLPTLKDLETFWTHNKNKFKYAAQGIELVSNNDYMQAYEWFFSSDIVNLMKASLRWNELGTFARFYDIMKEDPSGAEFFFKDGEIYKSTKIKENDWTEDDEKEYQQYSRKNYKGYWILENLPCGISFIDFSDGCPEISDPNIDSEKFADLFLQALFHHLSDNGHTSNIEYLKINQIEEAIEGWKNEKLSGDDYYYGKENE